ncbi:hypothetical protein DPEC_G00296130 [Dallia pectoralis]|uniref:Uncharacterized protein n=1 Tax=Dallia pectoralis TaxID=75939 RepID=A0ACC2FJ53_DALPE|nr:hypothetical protein DPEC_G00296130 [Dallia pectoralis]
MVRQVKLELLEPQVPEVLLGLLGLQVHLALKDTLVSQAHLAQLDWPLGESLAHKVLLGPLVLMVRMEVKALPDLQVLLVLQVPGVYYFSYTIHVNGAHALVALYKNDKSVIFSYDEYNKGFLDQMSGSTVLLLDVNDTVYLQIPDEEANGVFAAENVHCTFSGFLIAST